MRSNIEAERARNMLTKTELCKKLDITNKSYQKYIQGNAIPSDKLIKMAEIFNCSTDYLLGLESHEWPSA